MTEQVAEDAEPRHHSGGRGVVVLLRQEGRTLPLLFQNGVVGEVEITRQHSFTGRARVALELLACHCRTIMVGM